jgi:hypothetical protein
VLLKTHFHILTGIGLISRYSSFSNIGGRDFEMEEKITKRIGFEPITIFERKE